MLALVMKNAFNIWLTGPKLLQLVCIIVLSMFLNRTKLNSSNMHLYGRSRYLLISYFIKAFVWRFLKCLISYMSSWQTIYFSYFSNLHLFWKFVIMSPRRPCFSTYLTYSTYLLVKLIYVISRASRMWHHSNEIYINFIIVLSEAVSAIILDQAFSGEACDGTCMRLHTSKSV